MKKTRFLATEISEELHNEIMELRKEDPAKPSCSFILRTALVEYVDKRKAIKQ